MQSSGQMMAAVLGLCAVSSAQLYSNMRTSPFQGGSFAYEYPRRAVHLRPPGTGGHMRRLVVGLKHAGRRVEWQGHGFAGKRCVRTK